MGVHQGGCRALELRIYMYIGRAQHKLVDTSVLFYDAPARLYKMIELFSFCVARTDGREFIRAMEDICKTDEQYLEELPQYDEADRM